MTKYIGAQAGKVVEICPTTSLGTNFVLSTSAQNAQRGEWSKITLEHLAESLKVLVRQAQVAFYGNGADGTADFDGSRIVLGIVPILGGGGYNEYVLTRDIEPATMIVRNGVSIRTSGFKIYVRDQLIPYGNAIINNNGNNGGTGTASDINPATGGAGGAAVAAGTLGGSAAGAIGGTGNPNSPGLPGANGTGIVRAKGGSGGNGGNGSDNSGGSGAGGTGGAATQSNASVNHVTNAQALIDNPTGSPNNIQGGGGGGGGGGAGSGGGGGGGGSGGGDLLLVARIIDTITGVWTGAIRSNGGAGGNGGTKVGSGLGDGGGGAGGGGGLAIVIAGEVLGALTAGVNVTATGGAKGITPGNYPGATATDGATGVDGTAVVFNLSQPVLLSGEKWDPRLTIDILGEENDDYQTEIGSGEVS